MAVAVTLLALPPQIRPKKVGNAVRCMVTEICGFAAVRLQVMDCTAAGCPAIRFCAATASACRLAAAAAPGTAEVWQISEAVSVARSGGIAGSWQTSGRPPGPPHRPRVALHRGPCTAWIRRWPARPCPASDNREIATSTMVMPRSFFRCAVFTRVTKPSFNSDSA